jgi:hypothetical protein
MSKENKTKQLKRPDFIKRADSFCEIMAEAISRLTPTDLLFSVIGGILICGTILLAIYLFGS